MKTIMITLVLGLMAVRANAAAMREPLAAALIKVKAGEATILDLREADEIRAGLVEKAVWLPHSEILAKSARYVEILGSLAKDKPVYAYCGNGTLSDAFTDELEAQGFKAASLGGYVELIAAGFATRPEANAKTQPCPYLCGK